MANTDISRRTLIAGAAAAGIAAGLNVITPNLAQATESKYASFGGLFGSDGGGDEDVVVDVPADTEGPSAAAYVDTICAYLDQIGIKYSRDEEDSFRASYGGSVPGGSFVIRMRIKTNSFGSFAHFVSWPYGNVSNIYQAALEACNGANSDYYWTTFYVDSDSDITVNTDEYVDLATCGPVCADLLSRLASIIDEAYGDHFQPLFSAVG